MNSASPARGRLGDVRLARLAEPLVLEDQVDDGAEAHLEHERADEVAGRARHRHDESETILSGGGAERVAEGALAGGQDAPEQLRIVGLVPAEPARARERPAVDRHHAELGHLRPDGARLRAQGIAERLSGSSASGSTTANPS